MVFPVKIPVMPPVVALPMVATVMFSIIKVSPLMVSMMFSIKMGTRMFSVVNMNTETGRNVERRNPVAGQRMVKGRGTPKNKNRTELKLGLPPQSVPFMGRTG